MLSSFPKIRFHGGNAHKISDKIYHLMRGQVFEIDGKKIFTFGGASSHDKEYRTKGKNWWKAELPSDEEYKTAICYLNKSDNNVDIIITHCAPTSIQKEVDEKYDINKLTDFLEDLKNRITYSKWFFGHYHKDLEVDNKHTAIFERVVLL